MEGFYTTSPDKSRRTAEGEPYIANMFTVGTRDVAFDISVFWHYYAINYLQSVTVAAPPGYVLMQHAVNYSTVCSFILTIVFVYVLVWTNLTLRKKAT